MLGPLEAQPSGRHCVLPQWYVPTHRSFLSWQAISWAREAAGAAADEVTIWGSAVGELVLQVVSWAAATAQTAYYAVFVMAELEPLLISLLSWARSLPQSP